MLILDFLIYPAGSIDNIAYKKYSYFLYKIIKILQKILIFQDIK